MVLVKLEDIRENVCPVVIIEPNKQTLRRDNKKYEFIHTT